MWRRAFERWRDVGQILTRIGSPDTHVARAVELLLFEMSHEKSLPATRPVLAHALGGQTYVAKLCWKHATRFLDFVVPSFFDGPALPGAPPPPPDCETDNDHIHRVLDPGAQPRPLHFGRAEWHRKGLGGWCFACHPA